MDLGDLPHPYVRVYVPRRGGARLRLSILCSWVGSNLNVTLVFRTRAAFGRSDSTLEECVHVSVAPYVEVGNRRVISPVRPLQLVVWRKTVVLVE